MEPTASSSAEPQAGTTTLPVVTEYIGVRLGYCGGNPHILGHRIKVKHVAVWHEHQGMTPAEIVAAYPTLSLAQVHAALAYYYGHRAEIDAEVADDERAYDELKAAKPSILEKARARKADAADDPLPPQ